MELKTHNRQKNTYKTKRRKINFPKNRNIYIYILFIIIIITIIIVIALHV